MADSNTSIEIAEAKNSNVARRAFALRVSKADGTPAAGATVEIQLDGPGSLSYAFSAKDQRREAGDDGTLKIDWFRRGIYDRDIKVTISATTAVDGASVEYVEVHPETSDTSYNFPPKKLRI